MKSWQIWIDTGGTFTDCIALDPEGRTSTAKVLSNSTLRGKTVHWIDDRRLEIDQDWNVPSDFIKGFTFRLMMGDMQPVEVLSYDAEASVIGLSRRFETAMAEGLSFEVASEEEAPELGMRMLTQTRPDEPLPPLDLRLATTKGTNALLERKGTPTDLFITEGFGDLPFIGDQKRPDLFALRIDKADPLCERITEVCERLDADGEPLTQPDLVSLDRHQEREQGSRTAAVCLMHSYKNSAHEEQVADALRKSGYDYISVSSQLSPLIKIIPRLQTTVVNAYLSPVLQNYIHSIDRRLAAGSFRMMTSAGGLVRVERFNPKDSLLSGPAGGVVGAASVGKQSGVNKIISFDMGGTSTDVARYDHGYEYEFEYTVGNARLAAPAISIETVAAGGGSICSYDGFKLSVGPESAGADPGPACYGAGGPLTLTDVNMLLGRLQPLNFGIPVSQEAAEEKFSELLDQIETQSNEPPDRNRILEGFIDIANERMADAIRTISLRKGYDPAEYALVAFGGAGAQHACAIARELDIGKILIPADAGLLSALGLGKAVVEEFAERQLLENLQTVISELPDLFDSLEEQAVEKLLGEGIKEDEIEIRRRAIFMRLAGQESTLELEFSSNTQIDKEFKEIYQKRYGHWIQGREIEIESIRVIASTRPPDRPREKPVQSGKPGTPRHHEKVIFSGKIKKTPVFLRGDLTAEQELEGPAIVLDPYNTVVIEPGWKLTLHSDGTLQLAKLDKNLHGNDTERTEAVALELFTNRFTAIAEEMGEMLRRTALSVNVKERMDFSCALLNPRGELVVNAPHIPVHLGALGLCVRRLQNEVSMEQGDVIVTNHPAFGGSHLPDVTVVTPVITKDNELIGFSASRAHHAEIGGVRPGSMPPDATSLAEEGVVLSPTHLVRDGKERWDEIENLLRSAEFPTRNVDENMADLQAAVAANHRGKQSLLQLVERHGKNTVLHYMSALKQYASDKMRSTLHALDKKIYTARELLDDGTPLQVAVRLGEDKLEFDFEGTGPVHSRNLNATPAIVNSVIIYVLRLLIDEPLPLNEGILDPVDIRLPHSLLNPAFPEDPKRCPAVVGGNVETSQRLVDLLLKPFEIIACSQGTMNNVVFGNPSFGYYETIGGGTGAGPGFNGCSAIHHHMTNTAGTDPEILEQRYPVRLDRYSIRSGSGGQGKFRGGDGIRREMTFLEPVSLSVLTQHRVQAPYGINGGKPGLRGKQRVVRKEGTEEELDPIDGRELRAGDRFVILTPGGGGYGNVNSKME